ncbi:MAG: hypothetical protein OXM02_00965 [Bacteroidota bacterium]|nr:hypothetical protein [Bacteroidota bacterium]MDE2833076.1 hypothetical protein [Bacteroidota bacterium]MDE2955415.1 hypothetical protein [Bacteroidota bacterium]
MDYGLIGKQVRILLYTSEGVALGVIVGRVADLAEKVQVAPGRHKDLAYVVDIEVQGSEEPYLSSSGVENEGWFALQDMEVVSRDEPYTWSAN